MPFPVKRSAAADGTATTQLLRSVQAKRYTDSAAAPGCHRFPIGDGEQSVFEAYKQAIAAAKSYIYCENQHMAHPTLLALMADAAARGVVVVFVAPRNPMGAVRSCAAKAAAWSRARSSEAGGAGAGADAGAGSRMPPYANVFTDSLPAVERQPNFVALGLATNVTSASAPAGDGVALVYVHAKVMIVDDAWYTIGSANQVDISMDHPELHTEVNAAVWDVPSATALRVEAVKEHAGVDTSGDSGAEAMRALIAAARANRDAITAAGLVGDSGLYTATKRSKLLCHAFEMKPTSWGL